MTGNHRARPEQSPLLLLLAFAVVGGLLLGLFQLVSLGDDGEPEEAVDTGAATDVVDDTASEAPRKPRKPRRVVQRQEGATFSPVPEPVCAEVSVDTEVTVLSYNIKSARIGGGLGAYAGIIRASGADIVLLQEVDKNRHVSGRVDQAAWLARNLGWGYSAFGANVNYGGGLYGTAVVSRYPLEYVGNTHLPNGPGGQQRGLLHVVADVEGVEVSLYNTHFQNRIDYLKVAQARRAAQVIGADPGPKILGGDFNSHPGSQPWRTLRGVLQDTWEVAGVGNGATHPSRSPRGRIDWLMHGGDGISALRADVLPATNSDHRAVRATYRVDGVASQVCGEYVG